MYSIRVENNRIDHKSLVVFFVLLWLVLCLFVQLWQSYLIVSLSCLIAAFYCLRKVKRATPDSGHITLDDNQLTLNTGQTSLSGRVLPESLLFKSWIALKLKDSARGQKHWLCIAANAVSEADFSRLARSVVTARQTRE